MVAQEVPTSSTMALPHGPTGVAAARRKLRSELCAQDVPEPVIDDAVLILSELLSNSFRHARPLEDRGGGTNGATNGGAAKDKGAGRTAGADCGIRAAWAIGEDGLLAVEVTDGGGPTRPRPSSPSLSARGGRGLGIVGTLSLRWGVRDDAPGEVTVWAVLPVRARHARRDTHLTVGGRPGDTAGSLDLADSLEALGALGVLDDLAPVTAPADLDRAEDRAGARPVRDGGSTHR
ncbi:ATP-binding protein [Actinacidiphila alni]